MKNNFTTTTAIKPAPVSQSGRTRARVAATIVHSASTLQKIDNDACTNIDRAIALGSNGTPAQWCSVRRRMPLSQTNPMLPRAT